MAMGVAGLAFFAALLAAGVYALMRSGENRLDARARRLRMLMLERALVDAAERCSECAAPLEPEFRCCAGCGEPVRTECAGCGGLTRTNWTVCPWCTRPQVVHEESQLSEVA